jgi:DNA-binding NtrC family response regulator
VKTVLIVDDDLGFAFWLGQALDRAGYEAWPAQGVTAAESLLAEVKLQIDLLVINASLPRALALATYLGRNRADFKVIAVYEEPGDVVRPFFEASAVHDKPEAINAETASEWVQIVRNVQMAKVTRHELRVLRKPTDSNRAF